LLAPVAATRIEPSEIGRTRAAYVKGLFAHHRMRTRLERVPRGASLAVVALAGGLLFLAVQGAWSQSDPSWWWRAEWPRTDFEKRSVDFREIRSGGPRKDGIPSIDDPVFRPVDEVYLPEREPVIGLRIGDDIRAYPLRILMWHEIVNDEVGDVPVVVTFCPLCNAAMVFKRRVEGRVLEFGTTGMLRHSDLVMYDRETESWWQQFLGEAIVGELTGTRLTYLPARIESFAKFRERAPRGRVLVPNDPNARAYGRNPYEGYDGLAKPFLYDGELPEGIAPLERVVRVGDEAWSLALVRERGTITAGDIVITWSPGQSSALDAATIAEGFDVGNVTVQRRTGKGELEDVPYSVDFAFAFYAFRPDAPIHTD
jgi:hypothetical protein